MAIVVVANIAYDLVLAGHFARYYAGLGVDEIIISTDLTRHPWAEQLAEAVSGCRCRLVQSPPRRSDQGVGDDHPQVAREYCATDDWVIPADPDEFIQFPDTLANLVADAERDGTKAFYGELLDRISPTGELTATVSDVPIWLQYPLGCDISTRMGCCVTKIALYHNSCDLGVGHHYVGSEWPSRSGIAIHHFKWRAGILEALERRIRFLRALDRGWWVESQTIVDYLKLTGGRIVPADFGAMPGWRPAWIIDAPGTGPAPLGGVLGDPGVCPGSIR